MQIHNLPERSAIADTDVYAVDTGTTTGKTPWSLMKSLIKTFTLQLSSLTAKTTAEDTDVIPIDDGTGAKKMTFGILKNQAMQKATPVYASGDASTSSATSWTNVTAVVSGLTFTTTLNRITTMMRNCRYLYNLLGTTDISGSGKSTVTAAIGGNDISGLSDGTITGAVNILNTALTQKRGTFTRASGQGSGVVDLSIWESAHVVVIYGYLNDLTLTANTQTLVGRISGVTLPITPVRLRGAAYTNAYSIGNDAFIFINTSGDLYVTTATASNTVYFNAVWIR